MAAGAPLCITRSILEIADLRLAVDNKDVIGSEVTMYPTGIVENVQACSKLSKRVK